MLTGSNVFEVTKTVAVQGTPGNKLFIVTGFVPATVPTLVSLNIEALSTSFFTVTSIVTPSFGKGEVVTFTFTGCEALNAAVYVV